MSVIPQTPELPGGFAPPPGPLPGLCLGPAGDLKRPPDPSPTHAPPLTTNPGSAPGNDDLILGGREKEAVFLFTKSARLIVLRNGVLFFLNYFLHYFLLRCMWSWLLLSLFVLQRSCPDIFITLCMWFFFS